MTAKLSSEEFDRNYAEVTAVLNEAAVKSGRTPDDITLLAAIKTVDADTVNYAVHKGINYIGENKVQELLSKDDLIEKSAHRHFIGHLQTNKVKDIIKRVEMIESVDSLKLASVISKEALKNGITVDVLLEVNIGGEDSKWGFKPEEVLNSAEIVSKTEGLRLRGLMAIPPICENSEENRKYFSKMYKLFIDIRDKIKDNSNVDILSMGMSDDFGIAIEEGATLVRVGTALFGKRIY